jgi:hypothetical protein
MAMIKKDTKKYHHYSPAFYGKDTSLFETSNRAKLGFANLSQYQKNLKPRSIELFAKFAAETKPEQQGLLREDSEVYMEALMDIVNNLNNDRDLMEFVVPTTDAILTEEPLVLREVVQNVISARGKDTFMQSLKSFMYVLDHRPATC